MSVAQTGLPPFYDENVNVMYQRILSDPLMFPPDMSHDAKSIMVGLLQRDPSRRLGAGGADEIKRHPFFSKHIDWHRYALRQAIRNRRSLLHSLLAKKIQPPFKPSVVRFPALFLFRWRDNNSFAGIRPRRREL